MSNRSACRFPDHHNAGRPGVSLLAVVVVVLAVVVIRLVLAAARFAEAWWWTLLPALAAAVVVVVLARRFGRYLPFWLRYAPLAVWANLTWRSACRRLSLISRDRHTRPGRRPRRAHHPLAVAYPSRHGIVVRAVTVAGVDREAVEKQAEHFRHHWRCARLTVTEPGPGRVELRGMRTDPLTAPLSAERVGAHAAQL